MRILFVHQNMPGQYRELLAWLVGQGGHEVVFLTQRRDHPDMPGVRQVIYRPHHAAAENAYGLSKVWEEAAGTAYGAAQAMAGLRDEGFVPDIVLGHTGWGELLFVKQVLPDTPVLGFFEYYYRARGGPVGFDPEEPPAATAPFLLAARNAVPNSAILAVDRGICPTLWQRDTFPASFHDRLSVCHDGIRTDRLGPDPQVELNLGRAGRLTRDDEIVTYVARNMERTRGFHVLMRALPAIQAARPKARILIVGGSGASYGRASAAEGGFRAELEAEVGHLVDWDRVHFLGRVPYEAFRKIVQVSRCHIYLTMPFVLSWSLLEAMAMEATIVASDVAPVREVMTDGETGRLVDFHDPAALAETVTDVLARPEAHAGLGRAARAHVVAEYDFLTACLPRQIAEINALVPPERRLHL
ncbi:glycosyltransferase family 4 protein [uncultured Jannaschia sp.]|uniref:glycosyltransferase family 4 protein n=1 Tax=uncultured Jannaschia sp. TaxID=293347 RepID=UPI002626DF69|nr:glycosyltransferase family 4 protein [uncultured Jannaschia sp.]